MFGVAHSGQALTPHRVALVLDREQGNGNACKAWQVALRELREGLVGNPLKSVIKVVAGGRGEPGCHAWVGGVSRYVHMDLTTSTSELTVRAAMVHGSPCVAEMVKHIPE
jgi:hypothetical protein